jgi:hypothetical protein
MHIAKALSHIRSQVRGVLEKHHHSPTIPNIFEREIEACLSHIKAEFNRVSSTIGPHIIWPKMVLEYKLDENDDVIPIWCPIRDSNGFILGLKVIQKEIQRKSRHCRVYLEWFPPEPE